MMNDEWCRAIRKFLDWLAAADRSPETLTHRRYQLIQVAAAFPAGPESVTTAGLASWLGSRGWVTETMRNQQSALRTFLAWAVTVGVVEQDPAVGLPTIRHASHLPRPVAEDQWRPLVGGSDTRLSLIVQFGARMGLRRGEIAAVASSDVVTSEEGFSLVVHGKGRKLRMVPMPDDLARAVLAARGWMFPSPAGGHLTAGWIGVLVRRATEGQWVPHQLRHRFATAVYAGSHDLAATQALLGHASPQTTMCYVRLADESLRAAARAAA